MSPTQENTLPPWMISILTKEEIEQIEADRLVPLHIPLSKEEVAEESDTIEEEGTKRTIIEIDIT